MSNDNEPTIGRLVADASRDISALVHSEIRLAKSEIRVSAKAGGIGAALLAIAAFFGLLIIILGSVSYTHLRAHETGRNLVCRLLLEKKKTTIIYLNKQKK